MWIFGLFILIVLVSLWASFLPVPTPEEDQKPAPTLIPQGEFPRIVLDTEEPDESEDSAEQEPSDASESIEPEPGKEAA